MKTIADLLIGEKAVIEGFQNSETALKLLELGCLPGSEVLLLRTAPFRGPSYLKINGTNLALRREEASNITITLDTQRENGRQQNH